MNEHRRSITTPVELSGGDSEKLGQKSPLRANLWLALIALLVTLLALEVALRTIDAARGNGFFSSSRNSLGRARSPLIPFRTFGFELYQERDGVRYISSRHGELYPLEKPEGTFRIVAFGGSTTENMDTFLSDGLHYPLALQSLLRQRFRRDDIEVINVGKSAYATPHSIILLELDVLSWEPDLIILSHNINDLSVGWWPDFRFDYSNKYSHPFYGVPDYASSFTFANVVFQHSQLYWGVKSRLANISAQRSKMRQKSYGDKPDIPTSQVFERNLRSFVTLAQSHGIQVILGGQALYPAEEFFTRHMRSKPYNDKVVYPLHGEFVKHHRSFNRSMAKVAEDVEAWFIDNDALMGGKEEYFGDFVHYKKAGIEKLAENYAGFIVANDLSK